MQQKIEEIDALGAQLLSISPMIQKVSLSLVNKLELGFPVLFDQGNSVAEQYGLVFRVAETLEPIYNDLGIDIPSTNGDTSYQLPLPATYIVDAGGIIRYSFVDVDHTVRLDPEVMIEEVTKFSGI